MDNPPPLPLARRTIASQLGMGIDAPGLAIRPVDLAGQFLVTGALPDLAPNTTQGDDPRWLWLTPTRRLLIGETATPMPPPDCFTTDVTDGYAVLELAGPGRIDILQMACPLDPDGPDVQPGRCAQTLFAGQRVILYANGDRVRLHIERPLAHYVLDWLRQAATAFT